MSGKTIAEDNEERRDLDEWQLASVIASEHRDGGVEAVSFAALCDDGFKLGIAVMAGGVSIACESAPDYVWVAGKAALLTLRAAVDLALELDKAP